MLAEVLGRVPAGCGPVGLLSGDEFMPGVRRFDRALLEATGPRIALLLAADPRAAPNSERLATAHYRGLGGEPVAIEALHRKGMLAAELPDYDVLFIAGGDPRRLLEAVWGTPLWEEALRRWREGKGLAGASAGAMALCEQSLAPKPGDREPRHWRDGLGPLEGFGLAVHASSRSKQWLLDVASTAPCPLVALDDETGVILTPDRDPAVYGPGNVWVVQS
jgi:peptidase S51-like protein